MAFDSAGIVTMNIRIMLMTAISITVMSIIMKIVMIIIVITVVTIIIRIYTHERIHMHNITMSVVIVTF